MRSGCRTLWEGKLCQLYEHDSPIHRETVNTADPSFSYGAGRGGKGLQPAVGGLSTLSRAAMSGNHGMVVITCYVYGQTELPSTTYHYTGGEQLYVVPKSTVQGQQVAFVQVKAWGAGGGSGCGKQGREYKS